MSFFKSKPVEQHPAEVEPFDAWTIKTTGPNGSTMNLRGSVWLGEDSGLSLLFIDAIADGLRRAGFEPEVTLERRTVEARS